MASGDKDKPLFFAMMGTCVLLLATGPIYWAYYNYDHWTNSSTYVETLRAESPQYLTPKELKDHEGAIASTNSAIDRYRLEMVLSGAGGLVLVGVALLLLRNGIKWRVKKPTYTDLERGSYPRPEGRIEVRFTHFQNVFLAGLGLFFGFLATLIFVQSFKSQYMSATQVLVWRAMAILLVSMIVVWVSLTIRAKRQSVNVIDASGVTRGDGRLFNWSEFQGLVTQTGRNRYGGSYVWRQELAFRGGESAWLIPARIKNPQEVFDFTSKLPAVTDKAQ